MASTFPQHPADAIAGDPRLQAVAQALRERLEARISGGALELPLLPQVAMDVLALTAGEDSDQRRLSDILRHDPAMTAHVLRIANSPLYRPRAPIDSLPQAIARLGLLQVRQIAFVVACKQRVFRATGFEADVHRAFRHSLGAALYARELAHTRRRDEEEAFLASLLHDIGRPILLQAIADTPEGVKLADKPAALSVVAAMHARAGGVLARRWGLPSGVIEAIAEHHQADGVGTARDLTMLVALADDLAHYALEPGLDPPPTTVHWAVPRLNLPPGTVDQARSTRPTLIATLQAIA